MDWSKTKTIFILVFLILDLFLSYQLYQKHVKNQLEVIDPTGEQSLKAANITYVDLPKGKEKRPYISAEEKVFTTKDIKKLKNQQAKIVSRNKISAAFDKPVKLGKKVEANQLEAVVQENMLYGSRYKLWNYDQDLNQAVFYETYNGKMIFNNKSAQLTVYLDDQNEIVSYDQTYLTNIKKYREEEETLSAIKALEALYKKGMLKPNSKVTKAELGYYTRVPELQVLVPTWHFTVEHDNETEHLFVNAFEGQVNQLENDQ
ncbi:two-component system WalR/WalK regulatory protein YycI [Weizmannia acidilactici]|uniref:Two-component system WalR/WalK regulatory protein YycI n=1 Tax=Weizmannia acidilactici TaxID=2607726 RepID=A0A5J4JHW4_9BACI|nr:two-component system regulatory protein YycI [Weizmannia acidilactici]GER67330.1 two-component system WalR/WalK regulatory protein YycI [Weizmannia acidilactici]GER70047.1 two-component system WalR/WalK regulatory protein YycI [Weizmannia acidilactici]